MMEERECHLFGKNTFVVVQSGLRWIHAIGGWVERVRRFVLPMVAEWMHHSFSGEEVRLGKAWVRAIVRLVPTYITFVYQVVPRYSGLGDAYLGSTFVQ